MSIIQLEQAAAALGYVLVERDIYDGLLDDSVVAEEMRCDFELLSATLVDDAITAGLGTR